MSALMSSVVCAAGEEGNVVFDVPATDASTAINEISKQSNTPVIFSFDKVKNIQTNQLNGQHSIQEALEIILLGTGLKAKITAREVITISLNERQINPSEDTMNLPKPKNILLSTAALATVALTPNAAIAQQSPTENIDQSYEANTVEDQIIVTGTRAPGRIATDSPVAVDVISANSLTSNGFTELGQSLQTTAPSFNFSRTQVSDGSDLFRPATLRGLQPDQTLVLINGKRRHNQSIISLARTVGAGAAGTDLNSIPLTALKSVQVLRDGAAAQYGSDAIAGVINLQLKDTVGSSAFVQWGETYKGDGDTLTLGANTGIALGNEGGTFNLTGEYRKGDSTNRSDPGRTQPNGEPAEWQIGDADSEFYSVFANVNMPVGEKGEVYAFGGVSNREALGAGFYRDGGSAAQNVLQIYPNGFLPRIDNSAEDISVAAGYRHELNNGWITDVSAVYGQNQYRFSSENTLNASIAADFLSQNPTATDAEIASNAGPTSGFSRGVNFDQLTFNGDISGSFKRSDSAEVYVSAGLEYRVENYETIAGDLASYSCGIDDTGGTFGSVQDATVTPQCGFQAFPGTRPSSVVDVDRNSYAAYVDMETDLTENWLVTGALRYEDFSDSGDKLIGKVSTRLDVSDALSLRGSLSTGFRAPSLQQSAFSSNQINIGADGSLVESFTAAAGTAFPASLGVEQLNLETSTNFGAGFVLTPLAGLTVTVDAYRVDIDDRLVLGGQLNAATLTDAGQTAAVQALADSGATQANFFSNAADTRTQGIDFVANYKTRLSGGNLNLTFAGNINDTDVLRINSVDGIPDNITFNSLDVDFLESGQPGERFTASANYDKGALSGLIRLNYFGETALDFFGQNHIGIPNTQAQSTVESAFLADAEIAYKFNDTIRVAIGGNNIFDVTPDELGDDEVLNRITGGAARFPLRALPYGFNGGTYYVRLGVEF